MTTIIYTGGRAFTSPINIPDDTVDAITEIAAALRSGDNGKLITGISGLSGNIPKFDDEGDIVDSGFPATAIGGTWDFNIDVAVPANDTNVLVPAAAKARIVFGSIVVDGGALGVQSQIDWRVETAIGSGIFTNVSTARAHGDASAHTMPFSFVVPPNRNYKRVTVNAGDAASVVDYSYVDIS